MIVIKISQKQQKLLLLFLQHTSLSSSEAHGLVSKEGVGWSLVSIKRELSSMNKIGLIAAEGQGRSRVYRISTPGRLFAFVEAGNYSALEPDDRYGLRNFNFDLFPAIPADIFSDEELALLESATREYRKRTTNLPPAIERKELERFIIELSWKSSKIEGNTYTLLDTEKLILDHKEAVGHAREEAIMILNHKDAFLFIREHASEFRAPTRRLIEQVHKILVKQLDVGFGFRTKPVGVTGSVYRPLDNIHQIRETIEALTQTIARVKTPYAKALIALLGISYIQPFEDGNKRTARLLANAILLSHDAAPLSYRSVKEEEYREAVLVFYELNSLVPFKNIFLAQYEFAAKNYLVR